MEGQRLVWPETSSICQHPRKHQRHWYHLEEANLGEMRRYDNVAHVGIPWKLVLVANLAGIPCVFNFLMFHSNC